MNYNKRSFLNMGQSLQLFRYFPSFPQSNINFKTTDGVLWIRTRGRSI